MICGRGVYFTVYLYFLKKHYKTLNIILIKQIFYLKFNFLSIIVQWLDIVLKFKINSAKNKINIAILEVRT